MKPTFSDPTSPRPTLLTSSTSSVTFLRVFLARSSSTSPALVSFTAREVLTNSAWPSRSSSLRGSAAIKTAAPDAAATPRTSEMQLLRHRDEVPQMPDLNLVIHMQTILIRMNKILDISVPLALNSSSWIL